MSTLDAMAHAFAKKYPTPHSHPNGGGYTWNENCGRLISRFYREFGKEPTGDVHSAYHAYTRSHIESTDPATAPPSAIHFWDIAGPENGHVAFDILGGGHRIFEANASVQDISGAIALGYSSVAGYKAWRPKAIYLGWAKTYADGNIGHFDLPIVVHPTVHVPPVVAHKPIIHTPTPAVHAVAKPAGKHVATKPTVGPIILSGKDWAYRRPSGDLAIRVARALQKMGHLPVIYKNDGNPGSIFDKGVQRALNTTKIFIGPEDGKIERGGSYGVQEFGKKLGKYTGKLDGHPEVNSWVAFAVGLHG